MKKNITLIAIAFIGIFLAASCKKSSNSSPYTMSASKNGTTVTASGQTAVYAVVFGTSLDLVGESVSGHDTTGFEFTVGNYNGVGTYSLSDTSSFGNDAVYASGNGTAGTVIFAQTGTLNIKTVTSTTISGTFSFTGTDGTQFTNGTFTAFL